MKKYTKSILVLLFAVMTVSCSDDYLGDNVDPNNPLQVSPDLVLPTAQTGTAAVMHNDRRLNTFGNLMMVNWSQSDGFSWYYDEFNYTVNSTFYDAIFDDSFLGPMKNYNVLRSLSGEYSNYNAIGEIMIAYHYQILVDTYGDVPYFDALQRNTISTPAYDDAQLIYEDLIVKLDEAIDMIKNADAAAVVPGADDVMFQGDMTSWVKFANTIKLRILVRQSGMASRAAYVQTNMDNIAAEGSGFITDDVLVNPGYLNVAGKRSPFYNAYGLTIVGQTQNNGEATCASDFIVNYLINTNDARINALYTEPATGHLGVPQGLLNYPEDDSFEPQFVSKLGPGILSSPTQDAPLFQVAEALFLQAEAVQRGFMTGDAKALYEDAITASFTYLGLGAGDASFYFTQPGMVNVNWDDSPNKIQAIITQKWVALNGTNGHESWVEYNRTGYPSGLPLPLNNTNADRPVRLAYPQSELTNNSANVPTQPNVFTQKIFWAN